LGDVTCDLWDYVVYEGGMGLVDEVCVRVLEYFQGSNDGIRGVTVLDR
jgi:hypothetical protein